jgi:hypothetical protein
MGLLNLCAVSQAARGERVDDFGAFNSALPDPELNPTEAVSEAALEPPSETAEGAPDAPRSRYYRWRPASEDRRRCS